MICCFGWILISPHISALRIDRRKHDIHTTMKQLSLAPGGVGTAPRGGLLGRAVSSGQSSTSCVPGGFQMGLQWCWHNQFPRPQRAVSFSAQMAPVCTDVLRSRTRFLTFTEHPLGSMCSTRMRTDKSIAVLRVPVKNPVHFAERDPLSHSSKGSSRMRIRPAV